MAIIKCDDAVEEKEVIEEVEAIQTTVEPYVEQDEVSLGKTLIAVESTLFLSDTLNPVLSNVSDSLLKDRPQDITDTFRADSNRYWTLDENGNMKYMNTNLYGYSDNVNADSPPPPFSFVNYSSLGVTTSALGFDITEEFHTIMVNSVHIPNEEIWRAFVDGTMYPEQSVDPEETFSRPSILIPLGQTFTDHAFQMNTPFSKKELEMFANIDGDVSVADVESDYDFYAKAYEEGVASIVVPENALPHLYTEVQKSENTDENTTELPKGYLRSWVSEILSNPDEMSEVAKRYENVAILDSTVDEGEIIGSENRTISAFEILMSYANRENLFPMNMNIEVDTNNASDLMFEAEDVGMVDDIVELLLGDGNIFPPEPESGGGGGGSPSAEEVDLGGGGEGSPSGEESDSGGGGEASPSAEESDSGGGGGGSPS